jgi:hypothetical protein
MLFEFEDEKYRIERGHGTGRWLLFIDRGGRVGWRYLLDFDAFVNDEDIIDRAITELKSDS